MTTYLINQVKNKLSTLGYTIESPQIQNKRGSHITLSHAESWRICQCLSYPPKNKIKIIPDFRPDRYIRLGLAPLYVSFEDLDITVKRLEEIIIKKEYEKKDGNRPEVT